MHLNDSVGHAIDRDRIALVGARHIAGGALKLRRDVSDLHLSTDVDRNMAFVEHAIHRRGTAARHGVAGGQRKLIGVKEV